MTRETKIGLLVGLAFIIVIGILLSDHLTSSIEPPAARLEIAGANARMSVASPNVASAGTVAAPLPMNVTPMQPVPTVNDLTPRQPAGVAPVVHIGPAPQNTVQVPNVSVSANVPNNSTPVVTRTPENPTENTATLPLSEAARVGGEELVPAGNPPAAAPVVPAAAVKQYKAEPGDNLSRMALKFYGVNNRQNRELIAKANKDLATNPDRIIVGRTYIIPTADGSATPHPAIAPIGAAPTTPATPATPVPAENIYAVKAGDNLWKIATEQCGAGSAVAAIKELNREVLKGNDVVHPGMSLKLPTRKAN